MMRLLRCHNLFLHHYFVMILWWVCLFHMLAISYGGGRVREFKWDVDYMYAAPDCIEGLVMAINGQFPGPTIRAQVGDTIAVALTNKLTTEGVVIHWHGIRQKGTPWADGTASISQCAINPGETFHYRFTVDKAGTYLYHGHYGMQRSAGLYGSLIVEMGDGQKEAFEYDGEFNLLLSDWWHQTALQQEIGLSSIPFRWVGEPQSLLINGRGQYNCSLAGGIMNTSSSLPECKFTGNEQCAPHILSVIPNNTYRLRIASATSLASLNLAILNHKMSVVEADGNYVEAFEVDDIDIYSGESYSVLIKTDQDPTQNYWIAIGVRGRKPNTPQALTFLNYKPTSTSNLPLFPPPITPLWNDFNHSKSFAQKVMGLMGSPKPPMEAQRRIFLLNTQNLINGLIKWAINNVSLALPPTPYLGSLKFGLKSSFDHKAPPENFSAEYDISRPPVNPNAKTGSAAYVFEMNQVVDVILQNANVLNGNGSEIHPWHLHGHDFWVLGYGEGKFKGKEDEAKLNFKNPPLKNTVVVFPYGWTALRFRADNPGVWAFHCHIEPHLHMGMGVVFVEGIKNLKTMHVPTEGIACSITKKVISKMNNTHN